jgi:hypothetical protein
MLNIMTYVYNLHAGAAIVVAYDPLSCPLFLALCDKTFSGVHTTPGSPSVWASSTTNIYRIPLDISGADNPDSCSAPLLADGAAYALGVVQVDETDAYFIENGGPAPGIYRVPRSASSAVPIPVFVDPVPLSAGQKNGLALYADTVIWGVNETTCSGNTCTTVRGTRQAFKNGTSAVSASSALYCTAQGAANA